MSNLNVVEFVSMAQSTSPTGAGGANAFNTSAPIVHGVPNAVQNLSYSSGTGAQSNPFSAGTYMVRITPDADCWILIGPNPTANATNAAKIWAKQTEYFGVVPGFAISVFGV